MSLRWSQTQLRFGLLLFSSALGGALALVLGQDGGFDLRNYHWYNAFVWATGRDPSQDIAAAQLQSYLNPFRELPFYYGVQILGPAGGAAVLGALQGLAFGIVGLIADRLLPRCGLLGRPGVRAGLLFALVLASALNALSLCSLGSSRTDGLVSLCVLIGALGFTHALRPEPTSGSSLPQLFLSAFVLGLGIGAKPVYLFYGLAAALTLVLLPRLVPGCFFGRATQILATWACGLIGGLGLVAGPHAFEQWKRFGNPIFPLANQVFQSPWALPISFAETRHHPQTAIELVTYPFRLGLGSALAWEFEYFDLRFVLLTLLVIALILKGLALRRSGSERALLGQDPLALALVLTGLFSYVLWQGFSCVVRYLEPLVLFAPLAFAAAVLDRFRTGLLGLGLCAAGFLLLCLTLRPAAVERLSWNHDLFGIELPVEVPEDALVVMAGDEGTSYLVPSFPPATRFVRIRSSLSFPDDEILLNKDMREAIAGHPGSLLFLKGANPVDQASLNAFALAVVRGSCQPIGSRLEEGLALCGLERTAP